MQKAPIRKRQRYPAPSLESEMNRTARHGSSYDWLRRIKRCQMMEYFLILSIMLNIYFMCAPKTIKIVHYDDINHRNAVDAIRYLQCHFDGNPLIIKEIEWDQQNHIHASCLCGIVHVLSL